MPARGRSSGSASPATCWRYLRSRSEAACRPHPSGTPEPTKRPTPPSAPTRPSSGFTPRLLLASFAAYLAGEFLNSFVLAKLKLATSGRWLWMRTISSTLVGQLADSALFITVAFVGIVPTPALGRLIVAQWLFKSAFEAAATPLTYAVVNFLKRTEQVDHYDRGTDFNPFSLR